MLVIGIEEIFELRHNFNINKNYFFKKSWEIENNIIKKSGKTDLLGKNIKDMTVVMEIEGVVKDGVQMLIPLFYNPEWEKMLAGALEKANAKLSLVQKFCGENEYMLGYLTILDFKISELSYYIEKISKETFDKYPFLMRARVAVEALPEIKAYYESEKAMKGPFLPPQMAVIKF